MLLLVSKAMIVVRLIWLARRVRGLGGRVENRSVDGDDDVVRLDCLLPSGIETRTWMASSLAGLDMAHREATVGGLCSGDDAQQQRQTAPEAPIICRRIRAHPLRRASGRPSRWRAPSSQGTSVQAGRVQQALVRPSASKPPVWS